MILPILLVLMTTFVTLVVILRWFMGRYATSATVHLQGLSQDYLHKQEELKKRLEEAERHYQEQLAKSQEEARQLKAQAIKEADAERRQILEQARQEAERIVQQAMQARDALQQDLAQSVEARAVERACELIRQVLPEGFRQAAHRQWMGELLKNGLIDPERARMAKDVRQARVRSAFPLTAADRQQLQEQLTACLGYPVELQEAVEPELVAGLSITLGHLVLDGTLASKLREAARQAKDALKRTSDSPEAAGR